MASEARALLEAAVRTTVEGWRAEAQAEGRAFDPSEDVLVVLSGGVDSSLTFHLAASLYGVRRCITLLADAGEAATDAPWCRAVAEYVQEQTLAPKGLALEHKVRDKRAVQLCHLYAARALTPPARAAPRRQILTPALFELLAEDMPFLVATLQSFDPMALRNSVCVTRVLRRAQQQGLRHVLTGDAADELLAGYSFSSRLPEPEWTRHRQGMVARMHFDAIEVGRALGLNVSSPYLDPAFVAFALRLRKDDCVGPVRLRPTPEAPLDAAPTVTGKVPIRRAFPTLPSASRRKDPVEIGCGTTLLGAAPWATPTRPQGYFDGRIPDAEFALESARVEGRHGVRLRDKEHLAYFWLFEAEFGAAGEEGALAVPGKPRPHDDPCPACGFGLPHARSTFCLTCGHFDAQLEFRHEGHGDASAAVVAVEGEAS